MEIHITYYKGVLDFDPKPPPPCPNKTWTQARGVFNLESQKTLPGTQVLKMNAFDKWLLRCKPLKNFNTYAYNITKVS